jgi:bifunctional non-homologous end joining protein LigD
MEPEPLHFTDLDRVIDAQSGATKRALAEYYFALAKPMLTHVAQRPLALLRCPNGVEAKCFFQRRDDQVLSITDALGLLALVQRGFIELHARGSHVTQVDRADVIVFDLDADDDTPFLLVARAALIVHEGLAAMGLTSFLKTTGGRGLHVGVPIEPHSVWSEVTAFAELVAHDFVRTRPHDFVASACKRTTGKVFIDHRCNTREGTTIATYSLRALPGLPVAVPLAW